jgi:succinate dehydrogenase / fumarate reductase cytochrome b subunit
MPTIIKALQSQVGRKIMTALTGIGLMLFLVVHLAGNYAIFASADAFNLYTKQLESLGPLLYIAEAGLLFFVLYHSYLGVSIWLGRRKSRGSSYEVYKTRGGASRQNLASRSMIFSGITILLFLVLHIWSFKFGETEMITTADGETIRDLRQLVIDSFTTWYIALGYVVVLTLILLHLSHGAWSAFTSLGITNKNNTQAFKLGGYVFAMILMLGFLFIPIYIFLTNGTGSLIAY